MVMVRKTGVHTYETQSIKDDGIGQNLIFTVDSNNEKLINVSDADTGHNIASRP